MLTNILLLSYKPMIKLIKIQQSHITCVAYFTFILAKLFNSIWFLVIFGQIFNGCNESSSNTLQ